MTFHFDLKTTQEKSIGEFKKNRRRYLTFGLVSLLIFLGIIYLGPFGGLERFGLIGQKKEKEQPARAAAVRGITGDFWADVIVGRRDFTDVLAGGFVNPKWLQRPGGAVVDRDISGSNLGYLFAQSTRENRIIALNLDSCIPTNITCSAQKVIGQPSASDYSACNGDTSFQNYPNRVPASNSSLCFVKEDANSTGENLAFVGMFAKGGNLYVPDTENHRVLVYNNVWGDQIADEVLGQDDFSGIYCNKTNAWILNTTPSASSLCLVDYSDTAKSGSGVALDNAGNLWVADNGNHRVLRFPKGADGKFVKSADIVLGQATFTTGPGRFGSALNQMRNPNSLRFDASGNLYVADGGNGRILKFVPDQQKIGSSATFFANGSFVSEIDPINNGIWIINGSRLQLYSFDKSLKKDLASTQMLAGSIGVAKNGGLVVNSPTQGVYWASNPLSRTSLGDAGDRVLFDFKSAINNSRLSAGHGVAIAANKLFATDSCRILVWNNASSLTTSKAADAVLVQPSFTSNDCNVNYVANLKADSNNRVWAKTQNGIYVYDANNISVTGTQPIKIVSDPVNVLGGGTISVLKDYEGLYGLAPQVVNGRLFLWVSNRDDNRVVRIRDPLTNPVIDVVLGQQNLSGISCNRGQVPAANANPSTTPDLTMLCKPGAVSVDRLNNLYVSDHALEVEGNWRLLMFSASTFSDNNTSVIFAPSATKVFPRAGGQVHATWEPTFDSKNHMVVGYNAYVGGRFAGYYLNPTDPIKTQPDGYLKDFYSMPYGATFDSFDNLYLTDINRPRVMIYKNPFNTGVSSPTPSPTPTTTPTPTPTPAPAGTPSGDTQAPTVTITSPANGSTISGRVSINATASDNVGVVKMEIYIDDVLIASLNNASISYFWNTNPKKVVSGTHKIEVRARDLAGNIGTSQVTVTKP